MKKLFKTLAAAAVAFAVAGGAHAKITDAEAARLGKDLTPVGGEMAGNKDGTIPAYAGGLTKPPACFKPGVEYCDPFADEKPLFTITSANAGQYKDKLPPGALALLQKYPNFKMPVYPTHRTAAIPAEIANVAKKEATAIELNGFGLNNRVDSSIPFPIPKNGLEAIWNHLVRYIGGGLVRQMVQITVRPTGDFSKIEAVEKRIFDQNMDKRTDNRLFVDYQYILSPASLVGNRQLVWEPVDQVKEARSAWAYNSGTRRVRRAPDLAYDGVADSTEGQRTHDQFDGYNGAPDRYDWKLVGKKEIYVPYNTYKIGLKSVKYADVATKFFPNPDLMRYELHRVWVVEGTLKPGQKHVYGKRTFLLDEDTWGVVWEDAYDSRGGLWRVGMHGAIQYYDARAPFYNINYVLDLNSGAYTLYGLDNELKGTYQFGQKGRVADFTADALRRDGQ